MQTKIWKDNKNINCNNCGKQNHIAKRCNVPITSYGIIMLKIKNIWLNKFSDNVIKNFFIDKYSSKNINFYKNLCINEYINKNLISNKKKEDINNYHTEVLNNLEFCLIQRKHTVNYVQFIRGLYDECEIDKLIILFSRLTNEEYNKIKNNTFDELWKDIWGGNNNSQDDYNNSKNKFNFTKNYLMNIIDKIILKYDHPEWEFPKGRKNEDESDYDCAIREFEEETGISKNDIIILDKLHPIVENIIGSNEKEYKMIYYVGILKNDVDVKINPKNISHNIEISDIKFLSFDKANNKIRDFHIEKKIILNNIIDFIMYNLRYYDKYYVKNNNISFYNL